MIIKNRKLVKKMSYINFVEDSLINDKFQENKNNANITPNVLRTFFFINKFTFYVFYVLLCRKGNSVHGNQLI